MKINMLLLIVPPRNLKIALVAWFLYAPLNSGRKNKTKKKYDKTIILEIEIEIEIFPE